MTKMTWAVYSFEPTCVAAVCNRISASSNFRSSSMANEHVVASDRAESRIVQAAKSWIVEAIEQLRVVDLLDADPADLLGAQEAKRDRARLAWYGMRRISHRACARFRARLGVCAVLRSEMGKKA